MLCALFNQILRRKFKIITSDVTVSIVFLSDSHAARYTHVVLHTLCSLHFYHVDGSSIFIRNIDNNVRFCLGTAITFIVQNDSCFVAGQQFNISGLTGGNWNTKPSMTVHDTVTTI